MPPIRNAQAAAGKKQRRATPYPGRAPPATQSDAEYETEGEEEFTQPARRTISKSPKAGKRVAAAPAQPAKRRKPAPKVDLTAQLQSLSQSIAQLTQHVAQSPAAKKPPTPRKKPVATQPFESLDEDGSVPPKPKRVRKPRAPKAKSQDGAALPKASVQAKAKAKPRAKKQQPQSITATGVDGVYYDDDSNLVDAYGESLPSLDELSSIEEGDGEEDEGEDDEGATLYSVGEDGDEMNPELEDVQY